MLCRLTHFPILLLYCVSAMPLCAKTTRNASLMGTVFDGRGDSVMADVTAYRLAVRHGKIAPTVECSATVDPDGRFQCQHVHAGTYVLVVTIAPQRAPEAQPAPQTLASRSLPRFVIYPSSTDLQLSHLLHVASGETQWAYILIGPNLPSDVHATSAIPEANGQMQVFLHGEDFDIPLNIQADMNATDDSLEIKDIPNGTYKLLQNWYADGESREATTILTTNGLPSNQIAFTEDQTYPVAGSVQYDDHTPAHLPEVVLAKRTTETARRYFAPVKKDGSFTFKAVASGTYNISFNVGDGLFVNDISVGGTPTNGTTVFVSDGISDLPVIIDAMHAATRIAGFLDLSLQDTVGAKPGVILQSLDSDTSLVVPVDARGSFTVHGVPPGRYRLYGWSDVTNIPYESPHFVAQYVDKATTVDVENDSNITDIEVNCNTAPM